MMNKTLQWFLRLSVGALLACPLLAPAQTLVLTNGVHTFTGLTNTTVVLSNRVELRVTGSSVPLSGCVIHLNSVDAAVVLPAIRPTAVVSSYLGQLRVNGAAAVADSNCRVVQYATGAIVLPHAPSFQPLQMFSGPHFTGNAISLSQWIYYRSAQLGVLNANISSFKLKRGYAATLAQNENGSGISRNYVAQDGDMEVSVLPADLDNRVRFVYVVPWRWVGKKGASDIPPADLDAQWWYNWDINQNSTRDREYVAIKQQPHWPGLNQNWQSRGVNHLSGYNEPNNPVEDAYKNLTPPGAVDDAVARWPELLGTGLRVGAPGVTDGGQGWITDFMNKANAAGLRVDYVPIHYYRCRNNNDDASGAATQLYNFLKGIYDAVGRPLWVTEFNNGANWTGCPDPTYAQNANLIQAMIQMMDNTPWVERYAIYSDVEPVRRTHYDASNLSPMGMMYRDHAAPLGYLQGLQSNGTRSFSQLRFDGDSLDHSGHGNNGLVTGSAVYTNSPRGQALVFDGVNTKVTLPLNLATTNAFTFVAWVYWNGGGNWQRIFDFGNSTTHYMFLSPNAGGSNLRFAITTGGGNSEQRVQTVPLAQNQWQHVAVTLGGGIGRLYVNGTQVAIAGGMTNTPASFNPRVNFLGESQFTADPKFNGMMDDVVISDYVMSAAQIAALQTNTPPQFTNTFIVGGGATPGEPYSFSIAGMATDPDPGNTLTYGKAVGPAWLTVAPDGTISGTPGEMNGGVNHFTVTATDAAGHTAFAVMTVSIPVVVRDGVWISNADGNWSEAGRWSGGLIANGPSFLADFSTINITANRTLTLDSSRSIGTLRFGDTSGSQTWTLTASEDNTLKLDSGTSAMPTIHVTTPTTLAVPLEGTNGFAKTGTSTLILAGDNILSGWVNIDTSSTTVNEGIVRAAHPGALANVTTLQIRNNNSGSSTLQLDGSSGGVVTPANIALNGRHTAVAAIQNLAGNNLLAGNLTINVGGSNYWIHSDAGLLTLGGTITSVATGTRMLTFQGNGDIAITGVIANGSATTVSVSKAGMGRFTLNGTNTYNGTTTVSGGTLLVNGRIGAGGLTLAAGTTLGGHGSIASAVIVPPGATLAPGEGLGRLTVSNSVTLQSASVTRMEISAAPLTNDQLRATGTLTLGGTLVVTNVAGILGAGQSFTLFQAPIINGSFTSLNLPPLNPGLAWNTNNLSSGILGVVQTVATHPTNLTWSIIGDNLTLEWPESHKGWRLETNAASIDDSAAWFTLPGSAETNQVLLSIDPALSNVFFRLVFP